MWPPDQIASFSLMSFFSLVLTRQSECSLRTRDDSKGAKSQMERHSEESYMVKELVQALKFKTFFRHMCPYLGQQVALVHD